MSEPPPSPGLNVSGDAAPDHDQARSRCMRSANVAGILMDWPLGSSLGISWSGAALRRRSSRAGATPAEATGASDTGCANLCPRRLRGVVVSHRRRWEPRRRFKGCVCPSTLRLRHLSVVLGLRLALLSEVRLAAGQDVKLLKLLVGQAQ
jgi:hypothetical protein